MPRAREKRVTVLLSPEESDRFDAYCRERGFKKSTLIARLIREHLRDQNFNPQELLRFDTSANEGS